MTTVVLSCAESKDRPGWGVRNGGIKTFTLWTKLLRQHGVDAYMVTYDGSFTPWLFEHPPIIGLNTVRTWQSEGRDLKYMTGWIVSDAFIELTGAAGFYFFDAEMSYSAEHPHFSRLLCQYLGDKRIRAIGTHARTTQAWYMATFNITPHFIRQWNDAKYWTPRDDLRVRGRVGYMDEGDHTQDMIAQIEQATQRVGIQAEFIQVYGDEPQVRDTMRTCDVFLGMNMGKSALWGEGCPRSPNEAQNVGAIPIAFDVHGNHEYIINNYTGFMIERGNVDQMANVLITLLSNQEAQCRIRATCRQFAQYVTSPSAAWAGVKEFLQL